MQPPYGGNEQNSGWTRVGNSGQPYSQTPSGAPAYPPQPEDPAYRQTPYGAPSEQQYYGDPARQTAGEAGYGDWPFGQPPQEPEQPVQQERIHTVHQVLDPRGPGIPDTEVIPRRRKRLRTGPVLLTVLLLLALAVLLILLFSSGCTSRVRGGYGIISRSTLNASYAGDALIVRDETVYSQDGITGVDYVAEEGSYAQRGTQICTVYTSGFSTKELTTLKKYQDQIKTYHQTLLKSENTLDQKLTNLENVILARALETQALVQGAGGSLINQEMLLEEAMRARQLYLKQKYPDDQKLTRLYEDENSQEQRISSWTKQYAATTSGMISFYTDGYENAVNTGNYASLQPSEVRSMFAGKVPQDPSVNKNTVSVYRLVKPDSWGVLMLCDDTSWTPATGARYKLLIESFENTVVEATVVSFTKSGKELLIRLNVEQPAASIESVLYIRNCRVRLGESVDTLTVPSEAVYEQDGQLGIVILSQDMSGQFFVPCSVKSNDGTLAYIVPSVQGVLQEGMQVRLW